jgi:HPt (histidine-containing phosphotransfer) domain-containing protein
MPRETQSHTPDSPALTFDEAAALDALGGDRELLAIVARAFVDDAPKLLERLRGAIERRDAKEVQSTSHALKGSVRFFGTNPIYDVASSLETEARIGNLDRAQAAIAQLDACVPRLVAELARLRELASATD